GGPARDRARAAGHPARRDPAPALLRGAVRRAPGRRHAVRHPPRRRAPADRQVAVAEARRRALRVRAGRGRRAARERRRAARRGARLLVPRALTTAYGLPMEDRIDLAEKLALLDGTYAP